jgi:membrane fusion protein (multidrug efflux system)
VNVLKGAVVAPLRALTELQGAYQAVTVDAGNRTHIVTVKAGEQIGSKRVILSGLRAGDRIVVEGFQKVRDGTVVNPLPFTMTEAAR